MGDPTKPTWVRWRIVLLLMATAAMVHFNRISMSVAGSERIIKQEGIDPTWMGAVYSAYLLVYTLCMTPGGWLIDRRGPWAALAVMGFGSAIFVALTGLAGNPAVIAAGLVLPALLVIRALVGLVTAPIHPAAARTVSFWIPYPSRSLANGLVNGCALIGIAFTYTIFGRLMDWFDSWPAAFLLSGVVTLLLAIMWTLYAADGPSKHPGVNDAERRLIEDSEPKRTEDEAAGGILGLLRNRSLIFLTLSYATVNYFQYLFFYWMQYYFDEVLKLGKVDGRFYATIPTLGMAAGMFLGGWLAGRAERRYGHRTGRALVPVTGLLASAVFLAVGILRTDTAEIVTCFTLAMLAVGACEGPFWATAVELGGRHGATAAGLFNTGGNIGGLLAPVVTPLFSHYFGWQAGIGLAVLVSLAGAAFWWGIDPAERTGDVRPGTASAG